MRAWLLLLTLLPLFVAVFTIPALSADESGEVYTAESADSYAHFASQLGVLVPEKVLPQNSSVPLVKVASRLIGPHSWPVTTTFVASLHDVSKKLSSAMQANCTTELLPSPLAFSSTRGLGLMEIKHLQGAPCAAQCTKQVYPNMADFTSCTECTSKKENIPYSTQENAGIEFVLTLHYSRRSQLLGAAQPTMVNAFVDLLQDRGIKVKMVGSTYRLTDSAKAFAKYLPLDTVSFRYIAWELDVQFTGPCVVPFSLERENLILSTWQVQQPGQDFRIKTTKEVSSSEVVLHFVANHIQAEKGDQLVDFWRSKLEWWASELDAKGMNGTQIKLLKAHKVYDETLADQFLILAGTPRGPVSYWDTPWVWYTCAPALTVAAITSLFTVGVQRMVNQATGNRLFKSSRSEPTRALSLQSRPSGGHIDASDIVISQHPDGSQILLGAGSSGKVYKGVRSGVQPVAIKVLHEVNDAEAAAFAEEVELLRSLSFDGNIVQFYGACLQPESIMMVLEYMGGGDLMAAIANDLQNRLRWSRKGHLLALDIAKGLVYLHNNQVIHMDLKSKNILLNREQSVAKIADVGLSRAFNSASTEFVAGTLEYSAPEVLLGGPCTPKADIFSFGVILWEIVTHEQPSVGNMRDCRVPKECPAEIDALINACLSQDPDDRPTAKDICEIIRQWQQATLTAIRTARLSSESEHSKVDS